MAEIQTSFGVVKINYCYGEVTVDKTVWNRMATAITIRIYSGVLDNPPKSSNRKIVTIAEMFIFK